MAQNAFSPDAWTRARNRFIEDLSPDEKRLYFQATPETIFYDASAAEKMNKDKSTSRTVFENLQPFIEAIDQYGGALDVFANTYPLVMSPLWGGIRIVLHVRDPGNSHTCLKTPTNQLSLLVNVASISEELPTCSLRLAMFCRVCTYMNVYSLIMSALFMLCRYYIATCFTFARMRRLRSERQSALRSVLRGRLSIVSSDSRSRSSEFITRTLKKRSRPHI